jgi:hypothetical protein
MGDDYMNSTHTHTHTHRWTRTSLHILCFIKTSICIYLSYSWVKSFQWFYGGFSIQIVNLIHWNKRKCSSVLHSLTWLSPLTFFFPPTVLGIEPRLSHARQVLHHWAASPVLTFWGRASLWRSDWPGIHSPLPFFPDPARFTTMCHTWLLLYLLKTQLHSSALGTENRQFPCSSSCLPVLFLRKNWAEAHLSQWMRK